MAKAVHKWGWLQFADAVSGSQAVGGVCLAAEAGRLSADILSRCLAPVAIGPVFSRTHRTFAARTASPRQLALMGSKANSVARLHRNYTGQPACAHVVNQLPEKTNIFQQVNGAQGRNRTTDTVIFSHRFSAQTGIKPRKTDLVNPLKSTKY
jgi:hypothetical protein